MPVKCSTVIQVQLQKFTTEITVEFLVTKIEITPCLLGMEFVNNFDCVLKLRKNEILRDNYENITIVTLPTK